MHNNRRDSPAPISKEQHQSELQTSAGHSDFVQRLGVVWVGQHVFVAQVLGSVAGTLRECGKLLPAPYAGRI